VNLLYLSSVDKSEPWREALERALPDLDFRLWPDEIGDPAEIDYALVWKPPPGEMRRYANLKAILSLGAGVDHLLCDPDLPAGVPVVRLIDRALTQGMSEYVLYWVLHYHRRFADYARLVAARQWTNLPQTDTRLRRVGVLGLGELGGDAARKLAQLDFAVAGWSRSPKDLPGIETFAGRDGLVPFLERTEILVCLLPLTAETEGIIGRETLAALPTGAVLINPARGGHVVEDDLLAALDSGHIAAATLDVFRTEPLPAGHPFWDHPKVTVTPHMASLTVPDSAAGWVAENIRRVEQGRAPLGVVDRARGY